jgi:PAS domain S-box-containing protein
MSFRVIIIALSFFTCFTFLSEVNLGQPNSFDSESLNNLTEIAKQEIIIEWIEKSQDRSRWSHQARMEFAKSALNYSASLEDENLRMKAMYSIGELYLNEAEFDLAYAYFDTLSQYATTINDLSLLIKANNSRASVLRYRGDIFNALDITYNSYQLAREKDLPDLQALSANNLGIIYRHLGENIIALEFFNEALETAKNEADTSQIILAHVGLGNFYWFEKDLQKSRSNYEIAMELALLIGDNQHIASLNNNMGNIYREMDEYSTALDYYTDALDMLDAINVVGLKVVILRNIGLVYQKMGNFNRAMQYLQQSQSIAEEIGVDTFIRDNYLTISQLYASLNNVSKAYDNLLQYNQLNDKLNTSQLLNRISYFNDRINNAQRQEELYKYRFERNFFILIIALLFLVFIALFSILTFKRFKDRRRHVDRLKNTLQDKIITEKALRQSEENYQTLIKTLNEGLVVLDQDNRIEFLNQKASKILGVNDKDSLLGESIERFLFSSEDEKLFQEKAELQKMGISDHYEIKLKNLTGDVLWAHLSSAPILDQNLKANGSVALLSDITEKKKSEQTYGELTANLNQKIKQLNCLYDITDISGVPGITFEEIIEKSLEIIPVGLRYSHDIGVQIVFENKTYASKNFVDTEWSYSVPIKVQKKKLGYIKVAYTEEKPNINRDSFHFNEKILLKNISEKFGQIIESKNLELAIRENQEKLKEVQRIAKIGNWEKDFQTGNCTFSETFFDIVDISPERRKFFDYSRLLEIIHPDDKEIFQEFEKRLYQDHGINDNTTNYRIITHEGVIKFIFSSAKLIYDKTDKKSGSVFTVQDITDQKNTQELQHHAEVALKTSEAKQQVLANMSYEMRTPITGIMGMTDFLLQSGLNPSQMELAKTIKDSSIGLLNTINNILDLQRIEAGKFRLNNAVFSLSRLMERISSLFAALTRNREINLTFDIQSNIPESIISDQARLYQVITSLLSIATENAGKGNIQIRLRQENNLGNKMLIMVEVVDDFSNIDLDQVREIINPPKDTDDSILERKDNLSVGLAISKKLVDMLDGNIGVEKNNSQGTIFHFTFYTTVANVENPDESIPVNPHKSPENILADIKGVRVLCVEDQRINQKVINLMLSHAQCEITLAKNGKEAIEQMENNKFDIILLDMVMPVMDGFETLSVMKQKFKKRPPVIALSANVLEEDREKYFLAGVDDYISKPINATELYEKIEKWYNQLKNRRQKKSVTKK